MWACICRRDPYHGIMRSATVGYPQTVVIMAAVEELMLKEGQTLTHTNIFNHTQASVPLTECRQNDDPSIWYWDGNGNLLTGIRPAPAF